jgi:hypothetical protein
VTSPWQVPRTRDFVACVDHCLVDGHVGLLIGRRDDRAWTIWVDDSGEVRQEWVEAGRVVRA